VGPLVVEGTAELIEGVLLGTEVRTRGEGGLLLEIAMHAFVPGVLLGLAGLDELWGDAELDPPDGELREATDGGRGEGVAVVGSDTLGETKLAKEVTEAAEGGVEIETEHAAALVKEAGVAVLDGEGKAEVTVAGAELTLEVGGPGPVGLLEEGERAAGVSASAARLGVIDEPVAIQNAMNRIHGGNHIDGRIVPEEAPELTSTPGAALPELENALDDPRRGGVRTGVGAS
jgi:hypothetical protein